MESVKKTVYEQSGNINKETGNLKRSPKEILELKTTITKTKLSKAYLNRQKKE